MKELQAITGLQKIGTKWPPIGSVRHKSRNPDRSFFARGNWRV